MKEKNERKRDKAGKCNKECFDVCLFFIDVEAGSVPVDVAVQEWLLF